MIEKIIEYLNKRLNREKNELASIEQVISENETNRMRIKAVISEIESIIEEIRNIKIWQSTVKK